MSQKTIGVNNSQQVQQSFLAEGNVPTPRDGHSAILDKDFNMYVFGGDRHHMGFNDIFVIKLA